MGGVESGISLFGQDLLTVFDTITNTVLMPVCAFFSCITVGWFIGPRKTHEELKEDGQNLGWFEKVFSVMVKYVTPLLILAIEIFGVFDLILPVNKETGARVFDANGMGITLSAYGLLAVGIIVYFAFFRKKSCGFNADEEEIEAA